MYRVDQKGFFEEVLNFDIPTIRFFKTKPLVNLLYLLYKCSVLGTEEGAKLVQCMSTALKELLDDPLVSVGSENGGGVATGQRTIRKGTGSNALFSAPME